MDTMQLASIKETIERGQRLIEELKNKAEEYSTKDGWIVESKYHVNVGENRGMNNTAFTFKSAAGCLIATVFRTEDEARKLGADYYLLDGNNEPIQMIFTKAQTFFQRECKAAQESLEMLKELINK